MLRWLHDSLFKIVSLASLGFLLALLVTGGFLSETSWLAGVHSHVSEIIMLVGAILTVAALAQYGPGWFPRIRKLGPVEFLQNEVPDIVRHLDRIKFVPGSASELSKEDRFAYERATAYLRALEFQGIDSSAITGSGTLENFKQLLAEVGTTAMRDGDWPRAAHYLQLLDKACAADAEPDLCARLRNALGNSYALWALDTNEPALKKSRNQQAMGWLHRAREVEPESYVNLFWTAFVQDELGQYERASETLALALKLEPDSAPAKLNLAHSQYRLGNTEAAVETLRTISSDDSKVVPALEHAVTDPEMKDLFGDEVLGGQAFAEIVGILEQARRRAGCSDSD